MISFDQLLSDRIGFGMFQSKTFLIVSLIDLMDGAEIQYLALLNVILMKEWEFGISGLIIMAMGYNFGLFVGAALCAVYADRVGRRNILLFGTCLQFITVICTAFAQNLVQMIILRMSYGLIFGCSIPVSQILMSECSPQHVRGKVIVLLQVMFVLGRIWMIGLAMMFLDNISTGNWRAMAIVNSIPCFLCMIGSYFYLEESGRFLIVNGRWEEGIPVIEKMGRENRGRDFQLMEEEIEGLKEWQGQRFQDEERSLRGLFQGHNFTITWRIWSISSMLSLVFGGVYLILPFILDHENRTLWDLMLTVIVEIPATIIVFLIIDNPTYGGRKRITIIGCAFEIVVLWVLWYYEARFLVIGLSAFKFFTRISSLAFHPLVTESYSTVYRSLGIGSSHGIGRVFGSLAPLVFFPIYEMNKYAVFMWAFVCKIFMLIVVATFPKDATQLPLDQQNKEKQI